MIEFFTNQGTNENLPLEVMVKKNKPTMKSNIILSVFFFGIILLSIITAGFIGKNFLSFFMFYLFFGFPLMIIYKDQIIAMIPKNIASHLVKDIQSINIETQDDIKKTGGSIKYKEYFILFLGTSCFILSIYILFKRRHELIGIFTSLFFCILSNIIIGDLF